MFYEKESIKPEGLLGKFVSAEFLTSLYYRVKHGCKLSVFTLQWIVDFYD